ncbi:MAG: M28 family peptidase [Sphingomonadales bacterium]|nr:M28 family peptidase [Sphingomonadales bacterium]MDE2170783.1 M28 family peptidase [Sphingomonadales bacterium]
MVAGILLALAATAANSRTAPSFSETRLKEDIEVLSSDRFEGRAPATAGEEKTIDYLASRLRAAGLEPGGDPVPGGRAWTQAVPLDRFAFDSPLAISFRSIDGHEAWTQGDEIAIRPTQSGRTNIAITDAPLVFIGYGVSASERNWDDFKGMDLRGKIALVLVNDPDFETGSGDFGGRAMTFYGRFTYKFEEAARHGALGVLVIHEDAAAGYGWNTVRNSNGAERFGLKSNQPSTRHADVEGWIRYGAAEHLFHEAGLDIGAEKRRAQGRDFRPVPLTGTSLSVAYRIGVQTVMTHNVIGLRPGTTHPDETVIYSAHWDHLGIGPPDRQGDRIFNGAADNASGCAELLELARAYGREAPPRRTVVFLASAAEEKGLLGAEFYVANPVHPIAKAVADINMDIAALHGRTRDVSSDGDETALSIEDDLARLARRQHRTFTPDPHLENGEYFRGDQFAFARKGVPALAFRPGLDLVRGGREAGRHFEEAYERERYHQPGDEYDPSWDFSGTIEDLALLYRLGRWLATSRDWPSWKAGSEFRVQRDPLAP